METRYGRSGGRYVAGLSNGAFAPSTLNLVPKPAGDFHAAHSALQYPQNNEHRRIEEAHESLRNRRRTRGRDTAGPADRLWDARHRLRTRGRWRHPAHLAHASFALQSEPGGPVPGRRRGSADARVPRRARRRRRLAQPALRGGAPVGRCDRRRADRARTVGRAPRDDPVGQCDRPCAPDARRLYGRHPGRTGLGRLLAAEPGPPQAPAHRRIARAWARLRRRYGAVRQGARRPRSFALRDRGEPQRRQPRSRHPVRGARANTGRRSRRAGGRRDHGRHGGEDPVHLGLDRPAQGRHQHARHAHRQPAADPAGVAVRDRTAARAGRLAAVEPYVRRQPQFQSGAAPCRHALHRRRQAGAGADRADGAKSRRHLADDLLQRAGRLRRAAAVPRARSGARPRVLRPAAPRSSMPAPRYLRTCGSGSRRCRRARPASASR